ncbi:hypothetical protein M406DRAFT_72895 [Cryphonectria parasitica EP155]|uniref:DUF7702 domain-containing protein n=1 Tax=Cryphonectria parasitica (strain ATCC 38755 / EP155) TaxID=660469 RepID=A0A9P4XXY9_CRYP1|nr:uncharacterized protein M406DRAFT_72895 [Cryphonectria parasitica EP155]KAF3762926.1 hypothetical protein M406DRAFT_72895 [Cryphonectria parasitica EP155]
MSSLSDVVINAARATVDIPPPPQSVINLAWADLIFAFIFLFINGWIAWKHGKAGMVCWQILLPAFIARIIADIYQIINKDQPMIPTAVSTMTASAVLACISLALIGIIYECNTILPTKPKAWSEKIILGVLHLFNTGGIAVATYGGSASATGEGGVINQSLYRIGTLILLFVLFSVCGWMWPTFRKIQRYSRFHPNARPARHMFWAAVAAMAFWLLRLAYDTFYAYDHLTELDPVMGTFGTKLVLVFGTYLGASIALLAGGWLGMSKIPLDMTMELVTSSEERQEDVEMLVHRK